MKIIQLLAVTILGLVIFAGCGGNSSSSKDNKQEAQQEERTTDHSSKLPVTGTEDKFRDQPELGDGTLHLSPTKSVG